MTSPDHSIHDALQAWVDSATTASWLQPEAKHALASLFQRHSSTLFDPSSHRPLTAAFFGGTGVGKSSLLNCLAGEHVARTGVERPTSREISIFLHESIEFRQLPNDLPLSAVRLARHANPAQRQMLWIDMPDIDSVDESNRTLVLDWLPHVDVVIYVVSPERYRDDKGWSLLKAHGGEHAWLFVMNQWDRGEAVQHDDFRQLLLSAGFEDPIILKTIAKPFSPDTRQGVSDLTGILEEIASQHLLVQLDAHAQLAELKAICEQIDEWLKAIEGHAPLTILHDTWRGIWDETVRDLMEGLEWTFIALVRMLAGRLTSHPSEGVAVAGENPEKRESMPVLWDEWAHGRVEDALSQLMVATGDRGLPPLPLKKAVEPMLEPMGRHVVQRGQIRLRHALAMPGNALQRTAMRVAGFMSIVFPSLALAWASYQVVTGYYQSATQHLDYLGTDFAIHTVLLIGLAWLGPWFIYSRLKPSVEASALKGLRQGVREALDAEGQRVMTAIDSVGEEQRALATQLRALKARVEKDQKVADREYAPLVRRLLARTRSASTESN